MNVSSIRRVGFLALVAGIFATQAVGGEGGFVRLTPLPAPKIVASAEEYPGGSYRTANFVDGASYTEYASNGKGTGTFVEFDFGAPIAIGGFRHVDRNDLATVAAAELQFSDAAGHRIATVPVRHAGQRAGVTIFAFAKPVTAQRVRWQVTKLGNEAANCLGGAEIGFFKAGHEEQSPSGIAVNGRSELVVEQSGGRISQPLSIAIDYPYGKPADVVLRVEGQEPRKAHLAFGSQTITFATPVIEAQRSAKVAIDYAGQPLIETAATLKPARVRAIYLLPHSHVDIGYTHRQIDVQHRQWQHIETALELCRKTAAYPAGSRFKWNVEVLWAVDSYLRQAPSEKQQRLLDAIRSGQVGLDAMYGSELTGLCRPEELLRLFQWGTTIGRRAGVTVDSAMISDVPGLTWGTVTACAQAGVKYFSLGNNFIDGGRTLPAWEDKPFYWLGPDGREKVLCWLPYKGYALGHTGYKLNERLPERLAELDAKGYPYEIAQLRWNVGGDNGAPDATLSDVVREWNTKHAVPKMVIATTSAMFHEFEKRHAGQVPVVRGDFTPYWENGACSTARETAINRTAAERLVQAETLWAILAPRQYPEEHFTDAWRNVILYDEHTWGAYNSITEPDAPFVKDQWKVKQAFALDADAQSRKLLANGLGARPGDKNSAAVDVFNTSSWRRSALVTLSKEQSAADDVVIGPDGKPVRSQRLRDGSLAFLAADVPPLAAKRYQIGPGKTARYTTQVRDLFKAAGIYMEIDDRGAITKLRSSVAGADLCYSSDVSLNRYYYVLGDRVKDGKAARSTRIGRKEIGPLVESFCAESEAPGCTKLTTEVRAIDGLDHIDIINTVDKKAIREKEAIHFGFAFNVPGGVMRMDVPWGVMRPEVDQIAGSCKNWFSVGRWVDVSNRRYGVTWATLDAPMVEVGAITDDKLGSTPNPDDWLAHVEPSQTLYSMVMNNHWHTNYKADQDGPTTFRYALRAHKEYDPVAAQRFGIECSQPLVAAPAQGPAPCAKPFLEIGNPAVLVASIKPSADRKAWMVRLFNAGDRPATSAIRWRDAAPRSVWVSDLAEKPVTPLSGSVALPPSGLVTLRADFGQ